MAGGPGIPAGTCRTARYTSRGGSSLLSRHNKKGLSPAMRHLLALCLFLLSLPLYGLPTSASAASCGQAPLLRLAMGSEGVDVPAPDGIMPLLRTASWAIVGEAPRLLRDDLRSQAPVVYSWLPPLKVARLSAPALPVVGQLRGYTARLRIGSVQQLL